MMMHGFYRKITDELTDETGAAAIEYGVILMCIVIAIILAVTQVGEETNNLYERTSAAFPDSS